MRRSRSARCPSRLARRARRSASSRAARMEAVWRAYTTHVVTRKATSHSATQCRPLAIVPSVPPAPRYFEGAQVCGAGPGVVAQLGGTGTDRLPREEETQRAPAAGAHGLTWRGDAPPAPGAGRALPPGVLPPGGGGHYPAAARHHPPPGGRQRAPQLPELLILPGPPPLA